jgi:hypothetical protein
VKRGNEAVGKEQDKALSDLIPHFRRPRLPGSESASPRQELNDLLYRAEADALKVFVEFCEKVLEIPNALELPIPFLLKLAWGSKAWANAELPSPARAAGLVLIQVGEILRALEKGSLIQTAVEAYHLGNVSAQLRLNHTLNLGKRASRRGTNANRTRHKEVHEKHSSWRRWDQTFQKKYPFLSQRKRAVIIACLSGPEFGTEGCSAVNIRKVLRAKK